MLTLRKENLLNNYDMLFAVIAFLVILACKVNILHLPYYWDEMGAYMEPTHFLVQNGLWKAIPGFHAPHTFFGHPPGVYVTLAFLHKFLGEKIWISHLLAIVCSFGGVYFTYLLATYLCNRLTGLLASLLLFFTPIYFAQSGLVHGDLFITTIGIMAVYFALKNNYSAYLICGIYLVMLKESSAAIIFALLLYLYFEGRKQPTIKMKVFHYSVPLIVLGIFFIIQKIVTGMFLPNPYFDTQAFLVPSSNSLKWAFYSQGRIVLTLLILSVSFVSIRTFWKKEFTLFLLIVIFFVGTYSFVFFLPRYLLTILPYFCILGAYAIVLLFKKTTIQLLLVATITVLFISQFYGTDSGYGSFETDMQYVDIVTTHKAACTYVEETYPQKTVLALWPLSEAMREPFLGYVDKPITIASLNNEVYDIILYTPQGVPENQELKKIIQKQNVMLDKRFEQNGKYVEVYTSKVSTIIQ